jgi:hypothetical protein
MRYVVLDKSQNCAFQFSKVEKEKAQLIQETYLLNRQITKLPVLYRIYSSIPGIDVRVPSTNMLTEMLDLRTTCYRKRFTG